MRNLYIVLALLMLVCIGCEWKLKSVEEPAEHGVTVERYDRVQSLYLTTGDYSALQQMNTVYPQQTRTLIEDVLKIGRVNDPMTNAKFLNFYQDTTLQMLIAEVEEQYASMEDIDQQLTESFARLKDMLPDIDPPAIYAQIGSLDQSIIVAGGLLGISLDKYLGKDYPLYLREDYGYTEGQREMMTRRYIVPDCLGFYLLSLYPMPRDTTLTQVDRDLHIGKIHWVVNHAMDEKVFNTVYVRTIDNYMNNHKEVNTRQLLSSDNYQALRKN